MRSEQTCPGHRMMQGVMFKECARGQGVGWWAADKIRANRCEGAAFSIWSPWILVRNSKISPAFTWVSSPSKNAGVWQHNFILLEQNSVSQIDNWNRELPVLLHLFLHSHTILFLLSQCHLLRSVKKRRQISVTFFKNVQFITPSVNLF
jgi:hypothetical protein